MTGKGKTTSEDVRSFTENPYDPTARRPEDIARLFYIHNVPIIPVISKREILLGILKKDDLVSELSDIARSEKETIDVFIGKLAKKFTFDELLSYGHIKEFIVINLFGEAQGAWPRLKLFSAVENKASGSETKNEVTEQKEKQILEWIIYLVLEHVPRALYAVNQKGKTIFYNSHFEDIYSAVMKKDVDPDSVERLFKDSHKNEIFSSPHAEQIVYYNKTMKLYYEKVPLLNNKKRRGFLFLINNGTEKKAAIQVPGVDIRGMDLSDMMKAFERAVVVDSLKTSDDLDKAAKSLGITKKSLQNKMHKHGIKI